MMESPISAKDGRSANISRTVSTVSSASISSAASADGENCCSTCLDTRDEMFRLKLREFFMNPVEKFHTKHHVPWKLVCQVLKIILCTLQLALFGSSRSTHVNFLEKSNLSFKHLFLKDWDPSYETMPYPPATGQYAIYTVHDFYNHINFALQRYHEVDTLAIGVYSYDDVHNNQPPAQICYTHFGGEVFAYNQSYVYDPFPVTDCLDVYPVSQDNGAPKSRKHEYDIEDFLRTKNMSINFNMLISASLKISLSTVHLKAFSRLDLPDCYVFNIAILFDNSAHSGQVLVELQSPGTCIECQGITTSISTEREFMGLNTLLDICVIFVSIMSFILCCRSLFRAQMLRKETVTYFKNTAKDPLCWWTQLDFINLWYVMIVTNDLLTIIGSALKIAIENKLNHNYEWAGILLGTGNLLIWFGVLRYLGFFKAYNVLLLTIKATAPNVLRFLVCASVFYFGFTVCGWVVLGPYHVKFRTISTSSECLFSLLNGDDMFVTFSVLSEKTSPYIWWFSRVYIYSFVALFIYVILNLFVAVILDAYEAVKEYNENGFPQNVLQDFINTGNSEEDSEKLAAMRHHKTRSCICFPTCREIIWADEIRIDIDEVVDEKTPLMSSLKS